MVTIDALAARLRCSKTTLYALGRTRETLVRAVVVHFFRGATERVEAGLGRRESRGSGSWPTEAYTELAALVVRGLTP